MLLLAFLAALLLSVALVPLLMRHAQRFGFIDAPDPRKVHAVPIPRIGGLAMVIGTIIPVVVWSELDTRLMSFFGGTAVIAVFGAWDDRADLDYRVKFIGQILAAVLVTIVGDVVIRDIPFGPVNGLPDYIGIPLTVVFLVGITNAVNLADGLDGLASGIALLSVGVIAFLAYLAEGEMLLLLALAISGAICGFLRYNTHPATVFMGDAGSQFLGFALGFMVVVLTQDVNPAASPVLLVLILGLPILDTLSVMVQRLLEGRSPFSPDRNHLHHKLLANGLRHYEAVASIYVLQGVFVGTALFFRYESDLVLAAIYLGACVAVVLFIRIVRFERLETPKANPAYRFDNALTVVRHHVLFEEGPLLFLNIALPAYLLFGAVMAPTVPKDFGVLAALVLGLLIIRLVLGNKAWFLLLRLLLFVTIAFVTYLLEMGALPLTDGTRQVSEFVFFGLLAVSLVIVVRYRLASSFKVTPMDFLVILAMLSVGVIPEGVRDAYHLIPVIIKLVLLFYGAELILKTMRSRWSALPLSSLAVLGILTVRGLAG